MSYRKINNNNSPADDTVDEITPVTRTPNTTSARATAAAASSSAAGPSSAARASSSAARASSSTAATPRQIRLCTVATMAMKKVRSSKSNIPGTSRYWTPSEHKLFMEALVKFGPKDLKSIASYVKSRNMVQCRTHEQKCFMRLLREALRRALQSAADDVHGKMPVDIELDAKGNPPKDVYSVPSSCGFYLLDVVAEELDRVLEN